jgi:hypothetical protein
MKVRLVASGCALLLLWGCASAGASEPGVAPGSAIVLGERAAFVGFAASNCQPNPGQCLRGPAAGVTVPITQPANATTFSVSSSNAAIASGKIVMTGPGGVGSPAVSLLPNSAGAATLTVTGGSGVPAQLPITVTTISTMTIALNNLPTATELAFTVSTPSNPACSGFQAGYTFYWDEPAGAALGQTVTLRNFPAMGNGNSAACLFTSVAITVTDSANATLAQKTTTIPITLGTDNPTTISLP